MVATSLKISREISFAIKCKLKYHNNQCLRYLNTESKHSESAEIMKKIKKYLHNANIFEALKLINKDGTIQSMNIMMEYYLKHKQYENAITFYRHHILDIYTDDISMVYFIKSCIKTNKWNKAQKIIENNIKNINDHSIQLTNCLIDFYGIIGNIDHSLHIFDNIPSNKKDTVSINVIMKSLIYSNQHKIALCIYDQHKIQKNDISDLFYLKACIKTNDFNRGKVKIIKNIKNINSHSIEFINTLLAFYAHFGDIKFAQNIFNKAQNKNIRTMNEMMKAYNKCYKYTKTMQLFEQCKLPYNDVSYIMYIKACIYIGLYRKLKELIGCNIKNPIDHSVHLQNLLIDVYGKCNDIDHAQRIFDDMKHKDIISINAMMSAYNHCSHYNKTLNLFYDAMQSGLYELDSFFYCNALSATANSLSMNEGLKVLDYLKNDRNYHRIYAQIHVKCALISLYAKCGYFEDAIRIGMDSDIENKFICSAMMDCYAKMGNFEKVFSLFYDLKKGQNDINIHHDHMIYVIVLNACSHSGKDKEALLIFDEIQRLNTKYIHPHIITALIDCFGRTNHLNTAEYLYNTLCTDIDDRSRQNILKSLLSSCRIHNDQSRADRLRSFLRDNKSDATTDCIRIISQYMLK